MYNAWFDPREQKGRPIDALIAEFESKGSAELETPDGYDGPTFPFNAATWNGMSPLQKQEVLANFRLVYEDEFPVNWCPELGTVLANEEVDEWVEKGYSVERRPIRQYMMRITAYADRLTAGHESLDWPASTLDMQTHWIGKSHGAEITFTTDADVELSVFTTRPDTIFGATFMTVAPEHPAIDALTTDAQRKEVEEYRREAALKSELLRQSSTEKTGVFTGSYATNPATGGKIPIWVADYVLAGYGTGAIMGVPGQDERDWEFAEAFSIQIVRTVEPPADFAGGAYTGEGAAINSGFLDGLQIPEAKMKAIEWIESEGIGRSRVNFKLRDWLFSRQRYWGEPIPLIHYENGITETVPEEELPLRLPELQEFKPSGSTESPLALVTDWVSVVDHPEHGAGRRETNTMPQWAGSCWYYLRYLDPQNSERLIDPEIEKRWMPVDFYIGGSEHAVTHLLYSRFWHQVLYDLGHLTTPEPFARLIHQGMILGENNQKMSKSRGNVVNPDVVIADVGADALRIFEMFMGPLEMDKPWSSTGIEGIRRFLNRAWMMLVGDEEKPAKIEDRPMTADEERTLHLTIRKVTEDIEAIRFNTAVSAMMIFVNEFLNLETKPLEAMRTFTLLIAPFAPHFAEEVWTRLGGEEGSVSRTVWPEFDPEKIVEDEVEIVLQVNSKIIDRMMVPTEADPETLEKLAMANAEVSAQLEGKTVRKVIAVSGRLVNIIAS